MIKIAKKRKPKGKGYEKIKSKKGHAFPEKVLKAHKEGRLGKTKFGKRKTTYKVKKRRPVKTKTPKQKEKYEINLKREKALAGKGWKVARTTGYLKRPKKAIGKKGYPYAVLNKKKNYETFYTWEEKPSKKRSPKKTKSTTKQARRAGVPLARNPKLKKAVYRTKRKIKSPVKTKTPKQKEKYKKKVEKRIRKGKDIGWGW